jgi:hypothetical protein
MSARRESWHEKDVEFARSNTARAAASKTARRADLSARESFDGKPRAATARVGQHSHRDPKISARSSRSGLSARSSARRSDSEEEGGDSEEEGDEKSEDESEYETDTDDESDLDDYDYSSSDDGLTPRAPGHRQSGDWRGTVDEEKN